MLHNKIGAANASQLQSLIQDGLPHIDTVRGQDLVLVMGPTKSGKSTAINYLMGSTIVKKISDDGSTIAALGEGQIEYAPIDETTNSLTLVPHAYTDISNNLTYCDTPGFDHNGIFEQRVCAEGGIRAAIQVAKSIKILAITIDVALLYADASGNGLRASADMFWQNVLASNKRGMDDIVTLTRNTIFILTKASTQTLQQVLIKIKHLTDELEKRLNHENAIAKSFKDAQVTGGATEEQYKQQQDHALLLQWQFNLIRDINIENVFLLDIFDDGKSRKNFISFLQTRDTVDSIPKDVLTFDRLGQNWVSVSKIVNQLANDAISLLKRRLSLPAGLWDTKEYLADIKKHEEHLANNLAKSNVNRVALTSSRTAFIADLATYRMRCNNLIERIATLEATLVQVKGQMINAESTHSFLFYIAPFFSSSVVEKFVQAQAEYAQLSAQERDDGLFLSMRKFYIDPNAIDWSSQYSQELGRSREAEVYKRRYKYIFRNGDFTFMAVKQFFQTRLTRELVKEAETMAQFSHPNIVHFYGITQWRQSPLSYAIVMECMKCSLYDILYNKNILDNELPLEWRIKISLQIIEAIIYLHNAKFLHRDIKSPNVLLSEDRQTAKLTDFGISKSIATATDTVIGTPHWMAPEFSETGATKATDIFALGIVLAEIVNREIPFKDDILSENQYRQKIQQGLLVFSDKFPMLSSVGRDCIKIAPNERPSAPQCFERLMNLS